MNEFLTLFGDITISHVFMWIIAGVFVYKVYNTIKTYFTKKVEQDLKQKEQIEELINQTKKYPEWRQQSINIREDLSDKISNLTEKIDNLSYSNQEGMALTWRYRILRFDDEIRHKIDHTKEHYDQILEDIGKYEKFCEDHSEFPNNKANHAIRNIQKTYDECVDKNSFL